MASSLTDGNIGPSARSPARSPVQSGMASPFSTWRRPRRHQMARSSARRLAAHGANGSAAAETKVIRCAIYTRKSTEEGLQQEFNSLDAQREAGEAFIVSQKHEGWQVITDLFDDGGYTGANMDRPALKRLLAAVEARAVDCIVVYKVDRLSRSLTDFARIVEVLDHNGVSFVSVTQQVH